MKAYLGSVLLCGLVDMRPVLLSILFILGGHGWSDEEDSELRSSLDLLLSSKNGQDNTAAAFRLTSLYQKLKEEVEILKSGIHLNSLSTPPLLNSTSALSRGRSTRRNLYDVNILARQWSGDGWTLNLTTTTTTTTTTRRPKATRVPQVKTLTDKEREMHDAASRGWDVSIAALCGEGINPNAADSANNAYTPLHLAVLWRHLPAAMTLVRCAANVNAADAAGNTPLHVAVGREDHWMAGFLLLARANPFINNRLGRTASQMALTAADSNFAPMFNVTRLAWFFGSRALSPIERTAREYIRMGYYFELAKMCMDGVLNPNIGDVTDNRNTAMHAAAAALVNHPMLVQVLVRCGGNVNAANALGNTPLHVAVASSNSASAAAFLLHGADPFISNIQGATPYLLGTQSANTYIRALFTYPRFEWYLNNMLP